MGHGVLHGGVTGNIGRPTLCLSYVAAIIPRQRGAMSAPGKPHHCGVGILIWSFLFAATHCSRRCRDAPLHGKKVHCGVPATGAAQAPVGPGGTGGPPPHACLPD